MKTPRAYPRFITLGFESFDPVQLARETEKIVTRTGPKGLERKYEKFYAAGVYGGIATGYCIGCCLRCVFCWVGWDATSPRNSAGSIRQKKLSIS